MSGPEAQVLSKRIHLLDRVLPAWERTNRTSLRTASRRGFSLTELTLALGVVALFATIVTLAVVRGQLTSNTQKADRAVVATLDRLVDQAATSPFADLADGTFTRPESDSCADPNTSCPTLLKRDLTVTWAVTSGGSSDLSEETIDWVELQASTTWLGTTFTATRKVTAPTPNWREGWGVAKVDVTGASYSGDLYLVDSTTGKQAAGSAQIINGTAWLSAPLEQCGVTTDGCVLALGPFGALSVDDVGLDAVSAMSPLRLLQDEVTETSALLRTVSEAQLTLFARNGAGETATNPHLGSVCIWARFHDGLATRTVPFCNTAQPDQIVVDTYEPDAQRPWLQLAIPTRVPVKLYVDNPSGGCSAPSGTFRWNGSAWTAGGTCTSRTWGTPETIERSDGEGAAETFEGSVIELGSTLSRYDLTWTTDGGEPAAGGNAFHALWSHPRDPQLAPYLTCPAELPHCASGADVAPVLVSPRTSGYRVMAMPVTAGAVNPFTLTATDYDWISYDGPTTITATTLPAGTFVRLDQIEVEGELTTVETALSAGDVVVSASSATATAQLRYYAPSGETIRRATFALANSSGTRNVTVTFAPVVAPHSLRADPVRVEQGGQTTVNVVVIGTDGAPLSGVTITPADLPAGMTATSATSDANGRATITVSVTDAPSGALTFTLQASGVEGTVRVNVGARAGTVTLSAQLPDPVVFDQGSTTQVQFSVSDRSGLPMAGAGVYVWATGAGGSRTDDVYATSRGCETDLAGACTVTVAATSRATAGAYILNVSIGGVTEQLNLLVESRPYKATAPLLTLAQSGSSTLPVTIVDGAGVPVAGVSVTASSTVSGLTFVGATTGSNGVANISVSVGAAAPYGVHLVQLSGGGATGIAPVRVIQTVHRIDVDEVVVAQGETVRTELVAYDKNNQPVAGAVISAVSDAGIVVKAAPTNTAGRSVVDVRVPFNTTPTRYLVSLSSSDQLIEFLPVRVIRGIGSVQTSGTITAGSASTVQFRLLDLSGAPIGARTVTVTPLNTALKVAVVEGVPGSAVTLASDPNGFASVEVTAASGVASGSTSFKIVSGSTTIIVYAQVVIS